MRMAALAIVAAAGLAGQPVAPTIAAPSPPGAMRCGWLSNPTPGNFDLIDRDGSWEIAVQGGYQSAGFDDMPDMSTAGWVETNGPHGYGCACMRATIDQSHRRFTSVARAVSKPIAACRADKALPRPPSGE